MMYVPEGFRARLPGAERRRHGVLHGERVLRAGRPRAACASTIRDWRSHWPRAVSEISDKDAQWPLLPALILLTGATGFVGRQVLRALAEQQLPRARGGAGRQAGSTCDHRTRSRRSSQARTSLPKDAAWWAEVCRGVDTVIHVAWYAEPGHYLQSPKNRDCLAGTLRLAQGASRAKVRRFVGIGTCFEYDLAAGMLTVETPLKPSTPYAAGQGRRLHWRCRNMLPQQGVEFAWCRLFYLYGEGEDARRLVPYLRAQAARRRAGRADAAAGRCATIWTCARPRRMIAEARSGLRRGRSISAPGAPVTVRAAGRAHRRRIRPPRSAALRRAAGQSHRSAGRRRRALPRLAASSGQTDARKAWLIPVNHMSCNDISASVRLSQENAMKARLEPRINLEGRTPLETVIPLATPFIVFADPASSCNFKCTFCPTGHRDMIAETGRFQGVMKFELFQKIVDDLGDFDKPIKVLRMYKDGEPFLNKRLAEMVAYAKQLRPRRLYRHHHQRHVSFARARRAGARSRHRQDQHLGRRHERGNLRALYRLQIRLREIRRQRQMDLRQQGQLRDRRQDSGRADHRGAASGVLRHLRRSLRPHLRREFRALLAGVRHRGAYRRQDQQGHLPAGHRRHRHLPLYFLRLFGECRRPGQFLFPRLGPQAGHRRRAHAVDEGDLEFRRA